MKKNNAVLLSTPYILWMLAFTLIPLGVVGYYAMTDPATGAFTFDNLKNLSMYWGVLWDSILYSLISAFICLLLGYPVAYYIAHRSPVAQKLLYMLVMLPMCMSFLLRTLAWVGLLQDTGIINDFLEFVGIGRRQLIRTPGAVILGMVYNYLPYMILPLYAIIVKIDNRLIEAAEDLGANPLRVITRVVVPQSIPGVISGITMVFVPSVSTFAISRLLSSGMIYLVGDMIEDYFISMNNRHVGSSISLVMMVLIILSIGFLRKVDPDGEGGGMW